jgi:hypothetical protein
MEGEFVLIVDGKLKTFTRFKDIPDDFEHVIKFLPTIPDGPHTEEQHREIENWNIRFQELMEKEHARNNKSR